jgi:hypothetical protein
MSNTKKEPKMLEQDAELNHYADLATTRQENKRTLVVTNQP